MSRDLDTDFDLSASPDDKIIMEARDRFKRGLEYENWARKQWISDTKFMHGDNVNGYQWPGEVRADRDRQAKPYLTINKTRQHCLQITNDAKKNKPRIAARPIAGDATYRSAMAYNAIFRGIERDSRAQEVYTIATDHMVGGGWGYFRIVTDYISPDSDEQQIYIRPVNDPLSVILDYTITQPDGSDANWCIIFKDYPRNEFDRAHPAWADIAGETTVLEGQASQSTHSEETVRVAEYMRKKYTSDILLTYQVDGEKKSFFKSSIPADIIDKLAQEEPLTQRPTQKEEIEWFLIVGSKIKQRTTFPGKYIPVVRVVAEEYIIDGRMDRPGHVRALRDPQRMYNWWATCATEYASLQGKTPWLAPKEAIEGEVDIWAKANVENPAVLPWRSKAEDGTDIQKPERIQPPVSAPAFLAGLQQSSQDMMFVSGQYGAMMGEPSNEKSGKAINERQRQGDTATYHYIDALACSIRYAGIVIMDMLPYVYDTKRVLYATNPDGTAMNLEVDPEAKKHYQEDQEAAKVILNPKLGQYQVETDIGPDWGTKREETFNALTTIITQAPGLTDKIGDLFLKSADFDLADEAAERLRRGIPPAILGVGPTIHEQQLMAQLAKVTADSQGLREETMRAVEENAKLRTILRGKDEQRDIDIYDSETKRLNVVKDHIPPTELAGMIHQLVGDALTTHLNNWIQNANQTSSQQPGASDAAVGAIGQQEPPSQGGQAPLQPGSVLPQSGQGNGRSNGALGLSGSVSGQ